MQTGWKPMPESLKILFIFSAAGIVLSFFNAKKVFMTGFSLAGFYVTGLLAAILMILLNLVGGIFLVGLWYRYRWGWKFGIGYFIFLIVNMLLGLQHTARIVGQMSFENAPFDSSQFVMAFANTILIMSCLVTVIFVFIIYKNRLYFNNP